MPGFSVFHRPTISIVTVPAPYRAGPDAGIVAGGSAGIVAGGFAGVSAAAGSTSFTWLRTSSICCLNDLITSASPVAGSPAPLGLSLTSQVVRLVQRLVRGRQDIPQPTDRIRPPSADKTRPAAA